MKHFLLIALLSISVISFSQTKSFSIQGKILSETEKEPLESATIYLERIQDSTLLTYTISDKDGKFQLAEKTTDAALNMYISYVGFSTYVQKINIDKEEIDLGDILMKTDANALDEVVIKSRAPITIKRDTLEFNVKSFKTKKDANVEDLLKKLPGVEVDESGAITVNGKPVNKILVNGKPFFGNDPTITTRNLTKEIIEKVQVTDTKTDSEAFSGEDGDNENKTINLTIKEENNKGTFGRIAGGYGTEDRYEGAVFLNRFDNDRRLSILGGTNNINSAGFSFGEIQKMFGNARYMSVSSNGSFNIDGLNFGGASGITTTKNAGANYADVLSKKVDISANYFYSGADSKDVSKSERETFLPDTSFFTDNDARTNTTSNSHAINLKFDIKVDSTFLINIEPSFNYSNGDRRFNRAEVSRNGENTITNRSNTDIFSKRDSRNFKNEMDITKRFGDKGSFVKLGLETTFENDTNDAFENSLTEVFGDTPQEIRRDQSIDGKGSNTDIEVEFDYRYPIIAKKLFFNTELNFSNRVQEDLESTFDFNETSQEYDLFNTALSSDFEYIEKTTTPKAGVSYRDEKMSGSADVSYVFRGLENKDALRPEVSLSRNFEALELRGYINYRFSPKSSLYGNYSLRNRSPRLREIQSFQNVSNPLNIITGNPNLRPTNINRLYFGYNNYDFQKRSGFNSFFSASFVQDAVVSNTITDGNFVRTTTYANVNGNARFNGSASFSKTIKVDTIRSVKFRARMGGNYNKNVNFNNGIQYASKVTALNPSLRLTFEWKKLFEVIPNYTISFTRNTFDLDLFEDREFTRHTLGIQTATFVPKKLEWRNDINYAYNPNVGPGFQRSAWFWNSTLAYSVWQDSGTFTLKAYDLLNQNTNARRTATQDYIQDSQSTVLQQYFMLSFSWKFNSLGKKGETGNGGVFFFD